jgi:hypothetical protein
MKRLTLFALPAFLRGRSVAAEKPCVLLIALDDLRNGLGAFGAGTR